MAEEKPPIYEFGPFRLDAAKQLLFKNGEPVSVTPKLFETLRVLVERGGEQLSKDELMRGIWGEAIVEETNLTTNVSHLRKLLGETKNEHQYILTIPGEGYRFVAPVRVMPADDIEVVVRERTRTSLTVEETSLPSWWRSRKSLIIVIGVFVATLLVGAYLLFGYRILTPGSEPPPIKSIAVLPFKPLVADHRDEVLEMGIADTLITRLSSLKQVAVRPTSAVRGYTALDQDALAAGQEQRVDAVLDGSIQKSGDRIRINVRLISVANGQQVWAERFDEKFTDILVVQDSISLRLADAIVKVTGGEKELLTKRSTQNPEAYSLYVWGRYFWNKRTAESLLKSIDYFNQAIERDPNYALAYAGLADAYVVLPGHTAASTNMFETLAKAREYALKALQLDNQLPEPHATLATIASDYWDWEEAEKHFRRAMELNQNYPTAHQWYGEYLVRVGRLDESLQELRRASELDPTSLQINSLVAQSLYLARRYDDAIAQAQKTLELDKDFVVAHWMLGMAYLQNALPEKAIAEFETAVSNSGGAPNLLALLGVAYEKAGNRTGALEVLKKLQTLLKEKQAHPGDMAIIYTGLGDKERALEWLEKAYQDHSWVLPYIRVEPLFDPLRSDARFHSLVRRVEGKH